MTVSALPLDDPLRTLGDAIPVPLTATRFALTVRSGVAAVETWRTFRNAEAEPIEVTLTLPMPVRAVLHALDATVDGRLVRGVCQPRRVARESYEAAVDEGRLAVLHEEVLCGVHMVSVTHIPPGGEVTIRCAWAAFFVPGSDGRAGLRIPLTVGDVYGRSPLPDSDDLLGGGPSGHASLHVETDEPGLSVGGRPYDGMTGVPLDRPIDLGIPLRSWPPLLGRAHDGRRITLATTPAPRLAAPIDAAVLIDRSGSMAQACCAETFGLTKFEAVRAGLGAAARTLHGADRLRLFAFADDCEALGEASSPGACRGLLAEAGHPGGGTALGLALTSALRETNAPDILLVTDGKSHALDVAALVGSGRRFSVVLIGEDSLEAKVGHLAARSGGALIVARSSAVGDAVETAFAALRGAHRVAPAIEGPLDHLIARQDGLDIAVRWDEGALDAPASEAARALASSLAVSRLPEARAVALAVAEGLVGPLTSLVLVDRVAERQIGLPVTRKVALPVPATAAAPMPATSPRAMPAPAMAAPAVSAPMPPPEAPAGAGGPFARPSFHRIIDAGPAPAAARPRESAPRMARLWSKLRGDRREPGIAPASPTGEAPDWPGLTAVQWARGTDALARGDLAGLPAGVAERLRACAAHPSVERTARTLGLSPLLMAIGVVARRAAAADRHAARVARAIFRSHGEAEIDAALAALTAFELPAFLLRDHNR